ncbi:MAG: RDD family protein [Gammaproteobacteria bacterium]|jgi:uncharacterized RDD family membrane protein YckC
MTSDLPRVRDPAGRTLQRTVAGLGARSFAFILDWNFRTLMALAWYLACWGVAAAAGLRVAPWSPSSWPVHWSLFAVIPALTAYFLYHPLIETLSRGQTPGKRLADIEIVALDGTRASRGALVARNLLRLADALPLFYALGMLACLFTRNQVRLGDLAADTVLVYRG